MLVSIPMATFKQPHFLPDAVESILSQSHEDLELVICPVRGDDETFRVLEGYSDPRIKIVPSNYANITHQMNTAMLACRGKYMMYFCSDDFLLEEAIKDYVYFMEEHGAVVAYPNYYMADRNLRITKEKKVPSSGGRVDSQRLSRECFVTDVSFVLREEFIRHLPMKFSWGKRRIWEVWKKLAKRHSRKFLHFNKPTFLYRQHPDEVHLHGSQKDYIPVRTTEAGLYRDLPAVNVSELQRNHFSVVTQEPSEFFENVEKFKWKRTILHWDFLDLGLMRVASEFPLVYNICVDKKIFDALKEAGAHNVMMMTQEKAKEFALEELYT